MAGQDVTLADVVNAGVARALDELHTAMPGEVVSYDPVKNTAVIRPGLEQGLTSMSTGERKFVALPGLVEVPVIWPRAGGMVCRLPLAPGDTVWLMFSEGGLAEWKRNGGVCQPQDARRHSIGWPVALPGAFPTTETMSPIDAAAIALGTAIFGEDGGRQVRVGPLGIELAPAGVTPISPIALAAPLMACVGAMAAAGTAGGASDTAVMAALTAMQAALVAIGAALVPPNPAAAAAITASGTAVTTAATATGASTAAAAAGAAAAVTAAGAVPSTVARAV